MRNIVAGIDGVPAVGHRRRRRARARAGCRGCSPSSCPLALPVILTGLRIATVTTVGLVGITAIIQLGGLGQLIFDGYNTRVLPRRSSSARRCRSALAVLLDLAFRRLEVLLTPWARRRGGIVTLAPAWLFAGDTEGPSNVVEWFTDLESRASAAPIPRTSG